jgi:signal transduction histidine kinase
MNSNGMPSKIPHQKKSLDKERRKGERRKNLRRSEDRARDQVYHGNVRKLYSLLELGQLIGLDLQLDEMLLQIAQKACEVMDSDRCSLFLYDPNTDELWSTVALGMGERAIRIPSRIGLAGSCFHGREIINLEDAYTDPRFNKEIDAQTGYRTRSILCMPIYSRSGLKIGVIQLLNKKEGIFTLEDENFLKTFGNYAAVFIEMAQLQKARMDALEQSRKELERLNRAKSKALDHLSHELRTPLAVIQGNIRIMKRKIQSQNDPLVKQEVFGSLEKNLNRISDIQQETDQIIRTYQELEAGSRFEKLGHRSPISNEPISLYAFIRDILENVKEQAHHRDIEFQLEGANDLTLFTDPEILKETMVGLLKNAVENTPDEGMIRIVLEQKAQWFLFKVQDFGVGITEENQRQLFDGLFHTQDTELYTSKKPYDFGAGGKGLDLLRIKTYGQRFGFDVSAGSQRCTYLPTDRDLCPGRISSCLHCKMPKDCLNSGGSTFCVSFLA